MMAAGGRKPGQDSRLPNPPKNTETIYDGSWGAANLARIHGLPTPPKKNQKEQAKKKEGWQKNT